MKDVEELNPLARRYSERLLARCPQFRDRVAILEGGHFEASIPAPEGSRAGSLMCRTFGQHPGEVWIRFAPSAAAYPIDSEDELIEIVQALLADQVVMVVISRGEKWAGTTLIRPGTPPPVKKGQSARIFSWSGRLDADIPAAPEAKAKPKAKASGRVKTPGRAGKKGG